MPRLYSVSDIWVHQVHSRGSEEDCGRNRRGLFGGLADAKKKAIDLSSTVQDRVGPTLAKASERVPKHMEKASDAIKGAAGGAQSAIKSHWSGSERR